MRAKLALEVFSMMSPSKYGIEVTLIVLKLNLYFCVLDVTYMEV